MYTHIHKEICMYTYQCIEGIDHRKMELVQDPGRSYHPAAGRACLKVAGAPPCATVNTSCKPLNDMDPRNRSLMQAIQQLP